MKPEELIIGNYYWANPYKHPWIIKLHSINGNTIYSEESVCIYGVTTITSQRSSWGITDACMETIRPATQQEMEYLQACVKENKKLPYIEPKQLSDFHIFN